MSEVSKKWYVIRAISGKEKKVKELLELEIDRHNLNDYVDQVLIPTEKINLSNSITFDLLIAFLRLSIDSSPHPSSSLILL